MFTFEQFVLAQVSCQFDLPFHQGLHRAEALESHRIRRNSIRALKRFYRLYRLRHLLFRFAPGLADRLAI